jgi:Rrf2 family iron-sulfur cluster assembly transcriptional regulator
MIMRISTKGRHAVMAVVDLARHSHNKPAKPTSLAEIAQRQEISLSYLEQLVALLKSAGIVKSVRGPGGGYLLTAPNDQITVADVIMAVDDHQPRVHIDDPAEATGRQLTDLLWQSIGDVISNYLKSISLADVEDCRLCRTAANDMGGADSQTESNSEVAVETGGGDQHKKEARYSIM